MPAQYTLPPDTRAIGNANPPADMNNVVDAVTAQGAVFNVLNASYSGGADPTGAASSAAAFQAAIDAAMNAAVSQGDSLSQLCPTLVVPFGSYKIDTPLNFAAGSRSGIRITGTWGSRLFSTAGTIFDFQNKYLEGLEIDHLMLDAAGGHCFTGPKLKFSWLHHLYLRQNSPGYSIWDQTQAGNQLQNTYFGDIKFWVYPDPSTGLRSVPGWNITCNSGDAFAEVWFDRLQGWNQAGASGDPDNTQYMFSGACSQAAAYEYASTITFRDCSFHQCLGGGILLRSAAHVLFDGTSFFDVYPQGTSTRSLAASLLKIGTYPSGQNSRGIEFRGTTRSQGSVAQSPSNPSDIEVSSDTTEVLIHGWSWTGYQAASLGQIDLNGATRAVIIGVESATAIQAPAADTIIINNGQVTLGGGPLAARSAGRIPSDYGLIAWSQDLITAPTSTTAANGVVYYISVYVPTLQTITSLLCDVQTGAVTPVSAQCWMALWDSTGANLLGGGAVNVSAAGNLTATGIVSATLSAPFPGQGKYHVGLLFNAATAPKLAAGPALGSVPVNWGLGSSSYLSGTLVTTGATTMPASFTAGGGRAGGSAVPFVVGVS